MANWEPISVKEAIRKIKDEEIVLPVLQRRLVWSAEKMELLFDSLLRGDSFGSIICIEEEKGTKPLFAYRAFTPDGHNVSSREESSLSKVQWFVIDGQQRLQSFYIGLTGTLNGQSLYFDLLSNPKLEYDFKFAKDIDKLPQANEEKVKGAEPIRKCLWYPAGKLFEGLDRTKKARLVSQGLINEYAIEDSDEQDLLKDNVEDFYTAVFGDDSIGVSKVSICKTPDSEKENRQRIVELFRRLNDGGTKLSSYDLAASKLKGFNYRMEEFLDETASKNKDIGIDQDVLIKLLLILVNKPSEEISDLDIEDIDYAVSNRDRIQATLETLKKFLRASRYYEWFNSSKNRSAIPLYFLAYHIFHSNIPDNRLESMFDRYDTKDENFANMRSWLHVSLLNRVFSYGCGWVPYKTGIRKIHEVMQKNKGKVFPKEELINVYSGYHLRGFATTMGERRLLEESYSLDLDYIFYVLYDGQPAIRSEDIDHIHPRSLLMALCVEEDEINNIVNYQLLEARTNRGKNAKELADWINDPECVENKELYLKKHLIPQDPSLWYAMNFEKFRQARAKLLADKINTWL